MTSSSTTSSAETACDCCGQAAWRFAFGANGVRLGRCAACGLHYIAERPSPGHRREELETGTYGDAGHVIEAEKHLAVEETRRPEFETYVEIAQSHAPAGPWLDIGCGAGILMEIAESRGKTIEGIELAPSRRRTAMQRVTGHVHDAPLEDLGLPGGKYAAVFMIHVFSHLLQPSSTLREVRRILAPSGIVVLRTSEIGEGVRRHHKWDWDLGDHLQFLGKETLDHYADHIGFTLVERRSQWEPEAFLSYRQLAVRGRSTLRNGIKRMILGVPGLQFLFHRSMLLAWHNSPVFDSTLILRKNDDAR